MNFHLLRYTLVFLITSVAIFVLLAFEIIVLYIVVEAAPVGDIAGIIGGVKLIAYVLLPFLESDYSAGMFVVFIAAFGVAGFVEGSRYLKRNRDRPTPTTMLSGSLAMAILGLLLKFGVLVLIVVLTGERLTAQDFQFTWWGWFGVTTSIVLATSICRVAFGLGLREARWQQSIQTGNPI
ncbi:ABZJ_00895 family protein [Ruegeria sp. SCPT10]|uniref:ABZJ_00895 family protein n=1 Tax=Ruegeria sp. SCP10 TaxID=3141377 RepID=UPI00333BBE64